MMGDMRVVTTDKPKHYCDLPKWRERRRLHIVIGSVIQCETCSALWQWQHRGATDLAAGWVPVKAPPPPMTRGSRTWTPLMTRADAAQMSFTTITLTGGPYKDANGNNLAGSVIFRLTEALTQSGGATVLPTDIVVPLVSGSFSHGLIATDDPATQQFGAAYGVKFEIGGGFDPALSEYILIAYNSADGTVAITDCPQVLPTNVSASTTAPSLGAVQELIDTAVGSIPASAENEDFVRQQTLDQWETLVNGVTFWNGHVLRNIGAGAQYTDAANLGQTDSWVQDPTLWTRTGNYTFTIASLFSEPFYPAGTALKWQESGTQKYGVVQSVTTSGGNTVVTMVPTSDYEMVATNPDSGTNFFSNGTPNDLPAAFAWPSSNISGWSGTPTVVCSFSLRKNRVLLNFYISGTSNSTSSSITLPIPPATNAADYNGIDAADNGTSCSGYATVNHALSTTTAQLFKNQTALGGSWTSSGTKSCVGQLDYGFA